MRFYPFGSSSLNQVYNPSAATTASLSSYALSASYGVRVTTASYAVSGTRGPNGDIGVCIYVPGPTGDNGPTGFTGTNGVDSLPLAGSV
jgi:glyoxylate carboligase